ncbi:ABC-type nitrate/sulfonate transport permease (plasmid) [Sodalis praecaptivus]|uniref:ABC-type nitrate/sulfonate transport permease n=2 Tax=Sodalis praecaptivus TaxID=1239307 RepID=W0I3P4_9GAMM|nr:ABC-type nitrate/sulfonate transport permease [Sodalis praecaptivus]
MNRLLRLSGETGVILLAFLLWWRLSDRSESLFFPALRDMLTDAWSYWTSPAGWADMASTLGNIIAGFVDGLAAGIGGALLLGRLRALMVMLIPLIELLRATPNVILLPITISMLGIGNEMKQLNIAIAVFCPVFITTLDGYRHIPSPLRETARAFLLRPWIQFLYVTLPALLPAMLTGIHIAIPLSLITSITSEMVGETRGIGSVILSAQYRFDITRMWSGVLLLALLGFSVNKVFSVMKTAIIRRLH